MSQHARRIAAQLSMADLHDCDDCGKRYDLARQDYYGPRCPTCHRQHEAGA